MKYAVIERPSAGTLEILYRKMVDSQLREELREKGVEALGICQGTVLEILVASDIAEKAAGVAVREIQGSCPNHMTCLAVLGETSAVREAIEKIRGKLDA